MKIVIYGKESCSFCRRAKSLCQRKSIDFEYYTLEEDISREELEQKLGRSFRTVPQIVSIEDGVETYVGGFEDLQAKLS